MSQGTESTDLVEDIRSRTPQDAAIALLGRSPADIRTILSQLPSEHAFSVASYLAESSVPEHADSNAVLGSDTTTLAQMMESAPAILPASHTVAEAIAFMVKTENAAEITYIYVIDSLRLVGVVGMRDLILAKPSQTLADVMTREPFAFTADTLVGEAVSEALYRHYPMYPVVNVDGEMIGIVRGWKLYERIASEFSAQAGAQVGVAREEQVDTPVLAAFRMRHPWLQVNLLTAFAAAFVVGLFEDTITQIVALAVFLPVLAGQSGNTGCQALAITLRGLTLGKLRDYPVRNLLSKEVRLGALNGLLVGLVAGAAMFGYALSSGAPQPSMLGVVIIVAMVGACMGSGVFGVLIPIILKRFGADPATASSIFLTTFTDIIGMGLMLFLATALIL